MKGATSAAHAPDEPRAVVGQTPPKYGITNGSGSTLKRVNVRR
ncbi:hypothetical protein N182_02015 [Sinorhizobium sp. GL2]|nr:hypothetical protein N182_02015 [Sinorhizobium sp. GL2]